MFVIVLSLAMLLSWPGVADSKHGAQTVEPDLPDVPVESSASLDSLENALTVLNNLTSSQKQIWEQQQLREEEMRKKTQAEVDREAERTRTMEEEYRILQEMKGKVSRKLKAMSKPNLSSLVYSANEQDGIVVNQIRPRDCADVFLDAEETSGVYRIWPTWDTLGKGYLVYCDMDYDGGGWTVIRRLVNGGFLPSFYQKTWSEYKMGFGDLRYDFWLGNRLIYLLTNQAAYEVRFNFKSVKGNLSTTYRRFWIEEEIKKYTAHVEEMLSSSTAGDLFVTHNNAPFSTSDMNNQEPTRNMYGHQHTNTPCPIGWWFKSNCTVSSYLDPTVSDWDKRDMMIRPTGFTKLKESS